MYTKIPFPLKYVKKQQCRCNMTTQLIFHITTLILIFANQDLNEIEYQNRSHSYKTTIDKVSVGLLFSA